MMRHAGKLFVLVLVAVLLMLACWNLPLLGIFSFALLPTAMTLLVMVAVGAIAVSLGGRRRIVYYPAVLGALLVTTAAGLLLRHQARVSGAADVHQRTSVTRVVSASLREPVVLAPGLPLSYDASLFDTVTPHCRDPHCFSMSGLVPDRRHVTEAPAEVLERMGLKPVAPPETARLAVALTQSRAGGRIVVQAAVVESGVTTATWEASLPDPARRPELPRSGWARFWLEHNPLVAAISPRPYLPKDQLAAFLRSAIQLSHAGVAPTIALQARELHAQALTPPLRVDRQDPRYIGWWWRARDSRCADVLSVEEPPGQADRYLTFLAAGDKGPQLRVRLETVICAGDAVYLQRYGRTSPGVLDLTRYSLAGQPTAQLHVSVPPGAFHEFIAFDQETVTEHDGTLAFDVRAVRFEWARDAQGKPIRNAANEGLQYAIISREGRYAVTLPASALGD